jgi:hypothetical protein
VFCRVGVDVCVFSVRVLELVRVMIDELRLACWISEREKIADFSRSDEWDTKLLQIGFTCYVVIIGI